MSLKNLSVKNKIPKLLQSKLKNKKINQTYEKFEKSLNIKDNFIVAVSGGADSMALAFLSKIYSIKKNIQAKFIIVDHRLRQESTIEAKKVKQVLKKFSINSKIISWKGKKPFKNIQSIARNNRFELLFAEGERFKINYFLLGHHQDDLFENFFIRLLRGSGLKGLISLDKKSKINNKNLIRPLLDHRKNDLLYLTKKVFNFYVKDPSNFDIKYQRIRIRKLILELQNNGLDKKKFFKTIKNLKYSNSVVDFYVNKNLETNSTYLNESNRLILSKAFFQQPNEVIFRALSESIKLVGKKYYSVRGKKLDAIINHYINKRLFRVTLGGCIIEKLNQTVIISKEQ